MTDIREVPVLWHLPNGREGVAVFHFLASGGTAAAQTTALRTCVEVLDSNLVSGLTWTIPAEGRVIAAETGELVGVWTIAAPITGAGGAAGQQVADATQVLLRWRTSHIRRGRFLQGRTYVPALNRDYTQGGNITAALGTTWAAALADLVATPVGFGVWGRPLPARGIYPAAPGTWQPATSSGVWSELAVQRGRRG